MDGEEHGRPMVGQPSLYEGRVVEVSDPHNFWIQITQVGGLDDFRQLSQELSLFAERVGALSSLGGLEKGVYILVQSKDKDKPVWMRAQISRINQKKEEIDVFFNDYGHMEKVVCSQICAACPNFFFDLPWQAWKCGLAGIRPIAQTWTHRAIRQFKIFTMDQVLRVAIIAFHSFVHYVALYTADGDSVTHRLLDAEIGLPDNIEVVPRTASEVVYVLPEAYMQETMAEACYDLDANGQSALPSSEDVDLSGAGNSGLYYPQDQGGEEQGERRSSTRSTPSSVIPAFDVGLISHTKKTDPQQLHEQRARQQHREARHQLHEDLTRARQDIPEEVYAATADSATWGMKDDHITKDGWIPQHEVAQRISEQIREVERLPPSSSSHKSSSSSSASSSGRKRGDLAQKASPHHSPSASRAQARRKLDLQAKPAPVHSAGVGSSVPATAAFTAPSAKVNASLAASPSAAASVQPKPLASMSSEEKSIFMSSFAMCLEEHGDDAEFAKWSFSTYVQPDERDQPKGLDILLEFLVEEAVRSTAREEVCLSIISSYSDSYNAGTLVAQSLWRLTDDFMVLPPSGKTAFHKRFGGVVGKLFYISHQWVMRNSEILAGEILDLLAHWLEKCLECSKECRVGMAARQFQVWLEGVLELWRQGQVVLGLMSAPSTPTIRQRLQELIVVDQMDRPLREQLLQMLLSGMGDSINLDALPPRVLVDLRRRARPPCQERASQTPVARLCSAACQTEEVREPRRGGVDRQNSQSSQGSGLQPPLVTTPSLWAYRTWLGSVDRGTAPASSSSSSSQAERLKAAAVSKLESYDRSSQGGSARHYSGNSSNEEVRGSDGSFDGGEVDDAGYQDRRRFGYDGEEEMASPDFAESGDAYYEGQDENEEEEDLQANRDARERSGYGQEAVGEEDEQEYGESGFSYPAQEEPALLSPSAGNRPPEELDNEYRGWAEQRYEDNYYDEIYNSDEEETFQEEGDDKHPADRKNDEAYEEGEENDGSAQPASKWSRYTQELELGDGNIPLEDEESNTWRYKENALAPDLREKCRVEDANPPKPQSSREEDSPFEMLEDYPDFPDGPEEDGTGEADPSVSAEYPDHPPSYQGSKMPPASASQAFYSSWQHSGADASRPGHWGGTSAAARGSGRAMSTAARSPAVKPEWDPMPFFTTKTLTVMALHPSKPPAQAKPGPVDPPPPVPEPPEEVEEDPPLQPALTSALPSPPPAQGPPGGPGAVYPEAMSWSKMVLSTAPSGSSGQPYSFHHGSMSRFMAPKSRDGSSSAGMMSMPVPAGLKRTYEERTKWKQAENAAPSPAPRQHSAAASPSPQPEPAEVEEEEEEYPTSHAAPSSELPEVLPSLGAGHHAPVETYSPWLMQPVPEVPVPLQTSRLGQFGAIGTRKPPFRGRNQAPHPSAVPTPQWAHPPRQAQGFYHIKTEEFEQFGLREQAPDVHKPKRKPIVDPGSKLRIQEYLLDSDSKPKAKEGEYPTLMDAHPAPVASGGLENSAGRPDNMASIAFDLLQGRGARGGVGGGSGDDGGSNSCAVGGNGGGGGGGGGGVEGRSQGPASLDRAVTWGSHGEGDMGYIGQSRQAAYGGSSPWDITSRSTFRPIRLPDGREGEGFSSKDYHFPDPDHRDAFSSPRQRNGEERPLSPKGWQEPVTSREPPSRLIPGAYLLPGPPVHKVRLGNSWQPKIMCSVCGLNDHETYMCPRKHEYFT